MILHVVSFFRPWRPRWRFARAAVLLLWIALSLACWREAHSAERRPNILLILTDDQGWPTLSCYGNRLVATPHLDRLAAEGVRFTDGYATPQCTPSRATLLTGQYTARNGMWHVIPAYGTPHARLREPVFGEQLSRDTFTVAKGLRAAGYVTGTAGKWHLTTNADGDYTSLKPAAASAYGFDFTAPPGPGSLGGGDKQVDYLTDQAMAFIAKNRDRPWFFYLAHHTVHGRVSAPGAIVERYRAKGAPATGLNNATYLAAIEHLDNSIGRLMSRLDEMGGRDHTLVVFVSDNGGVDTIYDPQPFVEREGARLPLPTQLTVRDREFSNAPLRMGKGSHYEGGIRVPFIVRWPNVVAPNTVSGTPVHLVDLLPTFLAAAGGRAPVEHIVDGVDLGPHLRGGRAPDRALFWYMPFYEVRWGATPAAVMREGEWKLIEFFGDCFDPTGRLVPGARLELYNLRDDIGEQRDRAAQEPRRVQEMHATLRSWIKSSGAEVPELNRNFDPERQLLEVRKKPAAAGRL